MTPVVSKTDLARRTRDIIELTQRANVVIVESYGDECVVLLDILTYQLLTALAQINQQVNTTPEHESPLAEALEAYLLKQIDMEALEITTGATRFEILERLAKLGLALEQ